MLAAYRDTRCWQGGKAPALPGSAGGRPFRRTSRRTSRRMAISGGWWAAGFQLARAPVFQCPNVSSKGFSGRSGYLLVEWEGHRSWCRSLGVCPAQSSGRALKWATTLGVLTSKHPSCQAGPRDRQDPAALDAEGHASKKKNPSKSPTATQARDLLGLPSDISWHIAAGPNPFHIFSCLLSPWQRRDSRSDFGEFREFA